MGQRTSLFLVDSRTAKSLLRQAEEEDGYLAACAVHPANRAARGPYQAASVHVPTLPTIRLPRRLQLPVPIVFLDPSSDDSMPHSRPHMVCVSRAEHLEPKTMIHELWHVDQRLHQAEWASVFRALGWRPYSGTLPATLERHRRFNPDTIDTPLWIFQDTWVPVPLFRSVVAPRLTEADVWFYHTQEGHRTKEIPPALLALFPALPPAAYEHPRELAAYTLASPEEYAGTVGFDRLVSLLGKGALAE